MLYWDIAQDRPWADSQARPYGGEFSTLNTSDPKDNFYKTGVFM